MELNLRGKSAAITGASKGIGLAIAEELAREGVNLRLVARNREELQRAADDLRSRFQITVETEAIDLSQREARDAFAHSCAATDILINCAGAIPGGALDQVTEDAWRDAWDLKLFGYIGITRVVCTTDEFARLRPMTPRAARLSLEYAILLAIGLAVFTP